MGSTRGAVPTPSASPTSHFFNLVKSAAHLQNHENQLEMKKMQMNFVLAENLGSLQIPVPSHLGVKFPATPAPPGTCV